MNRQQAAARVSTGWGRGDVTREAHTRGLARAGDCISEAKRWYTGVYSRSIDLKMPTNVLITWI